MKVKIFKGRLDSIEALEYEINDWLNKHNISYFCNRLQSQSDYDIVISIFYN